MNFHFKNNHRAELKMGKPNPMNFETKQMSKIEHTQHKKNDNNTNKVHGLN